MTCRHIYNFNVTAVGTDPEHGDTLVPDKLYLDRRLRHTRVLLHHHTIVQHSVVASGTARDLHTRCGAGRRSVPNNASLAYSANCPPLSTCTVSPTQVNKGISGETQVTFTITTTAPVIAGVHPARALAADLLAVAFAPGVGCGLERNATKPPEAICTVPFASAYCCRALAGDCLQRRSSR